MQLLEELRFSSIGFISPETLKWFNFLIIRLWVYQMTIIPERSRAH
jgi:hypothetical protein